MVRAWGLHQFRNTLSFYNPICSTGTEFRHTSSWMSVCEITSIRHRSLNFWRTNSMWSMKMDPKQTTQTRGWNPVSKSLNKHGLWKWIAVKTRLQSRERRKTSGPDYTTRWQQDVSFFLFASASSVLLSLSFQYALSASLWLNLFSSFSLSTSVFSGACPGVLIIPQAGSVALADSSINRGKNRRLLGLARHGLWW